MATAVAPSASELKRLQMQKYAALSPTCRSSQVLTPRDLTRITIDDRHYDHYQKGLRTNTPHHIYSMPGGKIPSYGDRVAFHSQRDLPVKQYYDNTLIQRSTVRQTDELIPKPLSSGGVIDKEIGLPFPAEHPFTSHIEYFSMIPNTAVPSVEANCNTKVVKDGSFPVFVEKKASDNWSRVEKLRVSSRIQYSTGPVWDLPRSHRHQRCYTYPAPQQIYIYGSRQHTGRHLLRPYTTQGLEKINRLVYCGTSYQSQFPGYWFQTEGTSKTGVQNVLVLDSPSNNEAQEETQHQDSEQNEEKQDSDHEKETENDEFAFHSQQEEKDYKDHPLQEGMGSAENEALEQSITENKKSEADTQGAVDSTSMDQDLQDMLHLAEAATISTTKPYMSIDDQHRLYRVNIVPDSQLPGGSIKEKDEPSTVPRVVTIDSQPLNKSAPFTPRSAIVSRRLMEAYEFDKSAVKKRFHTEYPENAPDLRENSSQGKRHIIHGHHAYYFH